jgi:hypothetical protein
VRKGPQREPWRAAATLAAVLAVAVAAAPEARGQARGEGAGGRIVLEPSPLADVMAPLLSQLWASGFFRRNEAVRTEIQNNRYAFTDDAGPDVPADKRGCYFRRPGGPDVICLNRDMFTHFDLGPEGLAERVNLLRQILPVLVHEICHDLWANVLDARERAAFARESVELMTEYRMALTAEERRRFLALAGEDSCEGPGLLAYSEIDGFLAADPPRGLCGQEIFAWLAERLFATKVMVPGPLKKYYACILSGLAPSGAATGR